jgi:hypothetical protein
MRKAGSVRLNKLLHHREGTEIRFTRIPQERRAFENGTHNSRKLDACEVADGPNELQIINVGEGQTVCSCSWPHPVV